MPNVVAENGDIRLYGTVGRGFMDSEAFSSMDVSRAINSLPRNKAITVRLNSGGGIATEGAAIHSILSMHPGKKTVIVEGVAASAASIIAMAGDEIVMRRGSTMMVHDPAGITIGNSAAHGKTIEALETLATNMSEIYADKTGKSPADMRKVMKAETWFTAQEAVDAGFADKAEKSGKTIEATAFDYRLYQHAPDQLVALATDRDWQLRSDYKGDDYQLPEDDEEEKETNMTEEQKKAAAKERSDAITSACVLANKADRAPAFIADEKATVASVIAALSKEAADAEAEKNRSGQQETSEQMQARIRAEEKQRCADITAACTMARKPSLASKFIADGKSVTEALAALQADTSTPEQQISARGGNGGQRSSADISAGWAKHTKAANERFDAMHGGRVGRTGHFQ